jgi:HSP20 family protein
MVHYRRSPFSEFRRMQDTFDRLWNEALGGGGGNGHTVESWVVPVDVYEQGETIVVQASMPGLNPEAIDVTVEDGILTIKGQTQPQAEEQPHYLLRERSYGTFYRSLRLPDSVDFDKAETHFSNGVLTISFPKLESKKARRLSIAGGAEPKAIEGESRQVA